MSAEALSGRLMVSSRTSRAGVARMLPVSCVFHLIVLLVIAGLQLSSPKERALTAYHVSLVTLPNPRQEESPQAPQPAETDRAQPAPLPAKSEPTMKATKLLQPQVTVQEMKPRVQRPPEPQPIRHSAPPQAKPVLSTAPPKLPASVPVRDAAPKVRPAASQAAPMTTGRPAGEVSQGPKPTENLMREVLREIELPPQAPTLGHLKPVPATGDVRQPETAKKEIDALLGRLTVPTESTPSVKPMPPALPEDQPRPSLSEEVNKQLQSIQPPANAPKVASTPALLANPSALSKPDTKIQVAGNLGSNKYLALVQNQISRRWVAPQVDLTSRAFQVVIRFRLHRSGEISGVSIERRSGNGYYDDAGLRAVVAATPLPPFPPEMTDAYLDTHFTFTVGDQVG